MSTYNSKHISLQLKCAVFGVCLKRVVLKKMKFRRSKWKCFLLSKYVYYYLHSWLKTSLDEMSNGSSRSRLVRQTDRQPGRCSTSRRSPIGTHWMPETSKYRYAANTNAANEIKRKKNCDMSEWVCIIHSGAQSSLLQFVSIVIVFAKKEIALR